MPNQGEVSASQLLSTSLSEVVLGLAFRVKEIKGLGIFGIRFRFRVLGFLGSWVLGFRV